MWPSVMFAPVMWAKVMWPGPGGPSALTIREAIAAALFGSSSLTSVLGAKIFPLSIPERTLPPALTYQVAEADPILGLAGETGLSMAQFRFVTRSKSFSDCLAATLAIRDLLITFRGMLSGIKVHTVIKRRELDGYDAPDDASNAGTYSITLDYDVWYVEPLPANQNGIG